MSDDRYYDLTNYLPDCVDVAIERKKKVITLLDWPSIRIYYFDPVRITLGVNVVTEGDNAFHIFDAEKTVVDIIYYRNKIGIEGSSEVLKNYLKRSYRNLNSIFYYAKLLRCEKTVRR